MDEARETAARLFIILLFLAPALRWCGVFKFWRLFFSEGVGWVGEMKRWLLKALAAGW